MRDLTKCVRIVKNKKEDFTLYFLEDGRVMPFLYIGLEEPCETAVKNGTFDWEGYTDMTDLEKETERITKTGIVIWEANHENHD